VKEQERNKICKNDSQNGTGLAKTQKIFLGFWVCANFFFFICKFFEWVFGQISRFQKKKKNTKKPIRIFDMLIDNQKNYQAQNLKFTK
jgi:hypothetical protein